MVSDRTISEMKTSQLISFLLGIFIFANCVLKELFYQPSRQALLDEWKADKFPEDLKEA